MRERQNEAVEEREEKVINKYDFIHAHPIISSNSGAGARPTPTICHDRV